jgi:hypothetical protein
MPKLERIITSNSEVDRLQFNVAKAYDTLTAAPLASAQILSDVVIGTAPTLIAHGLGRRFVGWYVIRKKATGDVWESPSQVAPNSSISLQASTPLTVSLLVF